MAAMVAELTLGFSDLAQLFGRASGFAPDARSLPLRYVRIALAGCDSLQDASQFRQEPSGSGSRGAGSMRKPMNCESKSQIMQPRLMACALVASNTRHSAQPLKCLTAVVS